MFVVYQTRQPAWETEFCRPAMVKVRGDTVAKAKAVFQDICDATFGGETDVRIVAIIPPNSGVLVNAYYKGELQEVTV